MRQHVLRSFWCIVFVALVVSIFESYWSPGSSVIWLSLSFVPRPSFSIASDVSLEELPPASTFVAPAVSSKASEDCPGSCGDEINEFGTQGEFNDESSQFSSLEFTKQNHNDVSDGLEGHRFRVEDRNSVQRVGEEPALAVEADNITFTGTLVINDDPGQHLAPSSSADNLSTNVIRYGEPIVSIALESIPAPAPKDLVDVLNDSGLSALGQYAVPSIVPFPQPEQILTGRRNVEQNLKIAKQAIDTASRADDDESLYTVIYHNVSRFSKSYKMMEKIFKVFVYKEGKRGLVGTGPTIGIYASEGQFIEQMVHGSQFVTNDPEEAAMFFLPYSVVQMVLKIYVPDSHNMGPLNTYVKDYVRELASKYPFWNRTGGADHFFVSCHDWGPATARDHDELRRNAVKVVCNADLTEEFVVEKDASLPEIYVHSLKPPKVGGPGPNKRPILAFFAGQLHGRVRPVLLKYWKDKDPDMKIYEVLPKAIERKMSYVRHMKMSKYCICAAGFEVNSPRLVEAIYYDCVPVIIADNFVLPFNDVLDWNTFSVTVPESDIPNLKSILLSIPDKQYRAMQNRLHKVRQHFVWHDKPMKYDTFHMILHSVWMRRLRLTNL